MPFFRFLMALVLVVAVSLMAIAIEKRNLALQRKISLQHYRSEQLLERRAHLRLQIDELTSPMRTAAAQSRPVAPQPAGGERGSRRP